MVEWLDPQASMIRSYTLYFFTEDNSVEMDDIKNRRKFLKRVVVSNIQIGALYIGATVNVLGRHLAVVAFADDFTRNALGKSQESTFAMIKPNAFQNAGHIISAIEADGFHIAQVRSTTLTRQQANAFYAEHAGKPFFDTLTSFMSSGPIVALQLIADNAITKWRALIGPTNSDTARAQAPGSIRARFGKDGTQNAVHGSDSTASVQREVAFFFGADSSIQTPFPYDNVSVCVIKPHVLHEKNAGAVLQDLLSAPSFVVAAIKSIHLSKTNAGEFLQVYDGVIPSFSRHVDELASGPCLAIALAGDSSIVASTSPLLPGASFALTPAQVCAMPQVLLTLKWASSSGAARCAPSTAPKLVAIESILPRAHRL